MPHKIIKKLQGLSSERKLTLDTKLIDNENFNYNTFAIFIIYC